MVGTQPSTINDTLRSATNRLIEKAAAGLEITNGTVKGDIVIHNGIPHIIELAPRLSGGYFCTHQIPLHSGVDLLGIAIHLALGETIPFQSLTTSRGPSVAQRFLLANPGRVRAISGVEKAKNLPGVALCEIRISPGDEIPPVTCHPARPGVIIATGKNRDEAVARAEAAVNTITIETEASASC